MLVNSNYNVNKKYVLRNEVSVPCRTPLVKIFTTAAGSQQNSQP